MGAAAARLPSPLQTIISERCCSRGFDVAVAQMNCWRCATEDAHIIWVSANTGLFGIFDGHNGADCSQFIVSRLRQVLNKGGWSTDKLLLEQMFLHLDREFLETKLVGGSTATICIVRRVTGSTYTLHVLNVTWVIVEPSRIVAMGHSCLVGNTALIKLSLQTTSPAIH